MRILVTGAGGFIGRHLTARLTADGHEVLSHDSKSGDIAAFGSLDRYGTVDYVYHLAARTFVPDSWEQPFSYYNVNVMGTVNVLEYCRIHSCGVTLMSTYVYGTPLYLPVDEAHPVSAASPYHQSKLMCESLGQFYSGTYDLPVTVFRPFNIYGEGQDDRFLIPAIMRQLCDPKCGEIHVLELKPKRDYVYIDDVIEILIRAMEPAAGDLYRVFNIGSGVSTSVEDVILTAMDATGIHKPYSAAGEERRNEIPDCVAGMKKAEQELGVICRYSLFGGLQKWHRTLQKSKI